MVNSTFSIFYYIFIIFYNVSINTPFNITSIIENNISNFPITNEINNVPQYIFYYGNNNNYIHDNELDNDVNEIHYHELDDNVNEIYYHESDDDEEIHYHELDDNLNEIYYHELDDNNN